MKRDIAARMKWKSLQAAVTDDPDAPTVFRSVGDALRAHEDDFNAGLVESGGVSATPTLVKEREVSVYRREFSKHGAHPGITQADPKKISRTIKAQIQSLIDKGDYKAAKELRALGKRRPEAFNSCLKAMLVIALRADKKAKELQAAGNSKEFVEVEFDLSMVRDVMVDFVRIDVDRGIDLLKAHNTPVTTRVLLDVALGYQPAARSIIDVFKSRPSDLTRDCICQIGFAHSEFLPDAMQALAGMSADLRQETLKGMKEQIDRSLSRQEDYAELLTVQKGFMNESSIYLARAVGSKHKALRPQAVDLLVEIGTAEAIEALRAISYVREDAAVIVIQGLVKIRTPEALKSIEKVESIYRCSAAVLAAAYKAFDAFKSDKDETVRVAALQGLSSTISAIDAFLKFHHKTVKTTVDAMAELMHIVSKLGNVEAIIQDLITEGYDLSNGRPQMRERLRGFEI